MKQFNFMRYVVILCVMFMLTVPAAADVTINSSNFPDSVFRSYISSNFDKNNDGKLSDSEIAAVTAIDVSNKNVGKLDGVKTFTNLVSLKCSDNFLSKLDVSGLASLTELDVSRNGSMTELNISNTPKLTSLDFSLTSSGKLKTFNASNCTSLKSLTFGEYPSSDFNSLEVLNLSGCSALEEISLGSAGKLTSINLTGCKSLKKLDLWSHNSLTALDVSDCTELTRLRCGSGKIITLDLSNQKALTHLYCGWNQLTTLDFHPDAEFSQEDDLNYSNQGYSNQTFMEVETESGYKYYYDFRVLVPAEKISKIIDASVTALSGSDVLEDCMYDDGIIYLKSMPTSIRYTYDTGITEHRLIVEFPVSSKAGTIYKPTIQTSSLNTGITGITYTSDITVSSKTTQPVDWSITSGTLPGGLSLSASQTTNGKVSITGMPTESGTFTFTVQASNKGGTDSKTFSLIIGSQSAALPEITTSSLPNGNVGVSYAMALQATGQQPITWSLISGSLPAGLTLSTGGLINGTPSDSGNYTFTVQAQNSIGSDSKTFTLLIGDDDVVDSKPMITTSSELDDAVVNSEYEFQLLASGTAPITWKITKGKLPGGLKLSDSGLISGKVNKEGKFSVTIRASNSYGDDTRTFTITIYTPPEITTSSVKNAKVGKSYTESFKSKGTAPLEWKLEGDLPDGLTFDSSKGKITGKPTVNGTYNFTLTLSNAAGTTSKEFELVASAEAPKITTKSMPKGSNGKAYRAKFDATGTEPITWSLEGNLPDGLVFDSETGIISGTPTEMCNNQLITITASNMESEVSKTFSLTIKGSAPSITTTKLPDGFLGSEYSSQITATGTSPITFTASGLPAGLTVIDDTITGIPTESGKFKVTVTASNLMKTTTKNLTLTITSPPIFNDGGILDEGTAGTSYSYTFDVSGTQKITYSISGGSLPEGITLNANAGTLRGKPTEAGIFDFTVTAKNSAGESSMTYSMMINAEAPKITGRFKSGTVGKSYRESLKVSGTAPITWTLEGLPGGLVFADGMIIGTPTEAFDGYVTVIASNSGGEDKKTYRLLVKDANRDVSSSPEPDPEEYHEEQKEMQITPEIQNYDVQGFILDGEYVVVGILSEVSVDVSGIYDFDVVLSDDAEAGEKLIWLAFPKDRETTSDDEIAEFYDESGTEIECVPESRNITVSAWLTEGVTYEPVIAVKRKE